MVVGVDGCPGGWLCVSRVGPQFAARVVPRLETLLRQETRVIAIDIPIGLPTRGARTCDVEARKFLGHPRGCSVFPTPIRKVRDETSYERACQVHREFDGRGLSRQSFAILGKIREVDDFVMARDRHQRVIKEVHPEVSFAYLNGRGPLGHNKKRSPGRQERHRLIESVWPGLRGRLVDQLRGADYEADDLNDALVALWTAQRIFKGTAERIPAQPERDEVGLRMEMWV